jgi:hypothetical protein
MKHIAFALILTSLTLVGAAQPPGDPKWKSTKPINDLPNPYRRDANWARCRPPEVGRGHRRRARP